MSVSNSSSFHRSLFPLHTGINPQMETKAFLAPQGFFSQWEKPRSKHANTIKKKKTQNDGFWWTKSKQDAQVTTGIPPSPESPLRNAKTPVRNFPLGGALYQGTLPCSLRTPDDGKSWWTGGENVKGVSEGDRRRLHNFFCKRIPKILNQKEHTHNNNNPRNYPSKPKRTLTK